MSTLCPSKETLQELVESRYLYVGDISHLYISYIEPDEYYEHPRFDIVLLERFPFVPEYVPGYDSPYIISNTGITGSILLRLETAEDALYYRDKLSQMLQERAHPFQDKMENFRKPRNLFELEIYLKNASSQIGSHLIAGPDNAVDALSENSSFCYTTPEGSYAVPVSRSYVRLLPRHFEQGLIFVPFDTTQPSLFREDAYLYAVHDIHLLRGYNAKEEHFEEVEEQLAYYRRDLNNSKHMSQSLKEEKPWDPNYRDQMQEFAGPSGFIPWRGFPVTTINAPDSVYEAFDKAHISYTEQQKQALDIHARMELLDPYEIGAICHNGDSHHLETMIERNNSFLEMKRDAQREKPFDGRYVAHMTTDLVNRLERLHDDGFLDAKTLDTSVSYFSLRQRESSVIGEAEMLRDDYSKYQQTRGQGR